MKHNLVIRQIDRIFGKFFRTNCHYHFCLKISIMFPWHWRRLNFSAISRQLYSSDVIKFKNAQNTSLSICSEYFFSRYDKHSRKPAVHKSTIWLNYERIVKLICVRKVRKKWMKKCLMSVVQLTENWQWNALQWP